MEKEYHLKENELLERIRLAKLRRISNSFRSLTKKCPRCRSFDEEIKDLFKVFRDYYQNNDYVKLKIDVGNGFHNLIICESYGCEIKIEKNDEKDQNIKIKFFGTEIDRAVFDLEYHLGQYSHGFRLE